MLIIIFQSNYSGIFLIKLHRPPTYPLRLFMMDNASTFCITAAAGTELAGAYLLITVIIFINNRILQRMLPSSFFNHYQITLSHIVQYSSLLPPTWARTLSQFRCDCPIFQTSYRSLEFLGRPLPHRHLNLLFIYLTAQTAFTLNICYK